MITNDLIQKIKNYLGNWRTNHCIRLLESDRLSIYSAVSQVSADLKTSDYVFSVEYYHISESDLSECILVIYGNNMWEVKVEDEICYDPIGISTCFEYTFSDNLDIENSEQWMLALISQDPDWCGTEALQEFRAKQFIDWKESIDNPVNVQSLRNQVRLATKYGINVNVSHDTIFPSPEKEKDNWMEQDENGQTMIIPRQVKGLRIWNVKQRCYDAVDPHLEGAPTADEAPKYWEEMLEKLRTEHGTENVDEW